MLGVAECSLYRHGGRGSKRLGNPGVASELRRPVYRGIASRCIDFERILQQIASFKWDIKDIMSQQNAYINTSYMMSFGRLFDIHLFIYGICVLTF